MPPTLAKLECLCSSVRLLREIRQQLWAFPYVEDSTYYYYSKWPS